MASEIASIWRLFSFFAASRRRRRTIKMASAVAAKTPNPTAADTLAAVMVRWPQTGSSNRLKTTVNPGCPDGAVKLFASEGGSICDVV
jgi:hypothetical protein